MSYGEGGGGIQVLRQSFEFATHTACIPLKL